jgi:hypothetical protein
MKQVPLPNEDKEVVIFLKDDRSDNNIRQNGFWRTITDMLRITSKSGFACGMKPTLRDNHQLSSYHDVGTLMRFRLKRYASKNKGYNNIDAAPVPFASNYSNLGQWAAQLKLPLPKTLTNVCYAGSFAATVSQMRKQDGSLWTKLEQSLSRGNNIEEGHYAERAWGSLLSNPILDYQANALRSYSNGIQQRNGGEHGTLWRCMNEC